METEGLILGQAQIQILDRPDQMEPMVAMEITKMVNFVAPSAEIHVPMWRHLFRQLVLSNVRSVIISLLFFQIWTLRKA